MDEQTDWVIRLMSGCMGGCTGGQTDGGETACVDIGGWVCGWMDE